MGLGPVFLLLAGIFPFAPPGAAAEPHSLRYNLTVLSWDGSVQSGFLTEVHLDGQPFLRCDRQKCRAKPQGQWAEDVLGNKTWDRETRDLTGNGKDLRMTLAHIKDQKEVLQSSDLGHERQEFLEGRCHEDQDTLSRYACRLPAGTTAISKIRRSPEENSAPHGECHPQRGLRGQHYRDMQGFWLLSLEYHTELASGWGIFEPRHPAVGGCPA
uniref:MHC class I polypeptide-related sequence A n=1 Tax=Homo sapiens TaxID=9606 RepID=A0A140T9Z8_HUMAN